ncbi:phosphoenolpyruvate--protein phosphotransferase [Brackiella oedipodis]|uniref:phosphoenolpyruvate--protein phosphotransferase n=1 Tax=Brackiella oedipodis TaxID=124225 RepID=UPI000685A79E|nr:phosphoenolpyruvate--protein phosphotransferase [Brackiella oedipodis]
MSHSTTTLPESATIVLQGKGVSRGVVIGRAVLFGGIGFEVPHYLIESSQTQAEIARFKTALSQVQAELQDIQKKLPPTAPTELASLIAVHGLLVADPLLIDTVCRVITDKLCNAEWALHTSGNAWLKQFDSMQDDYLKERAADINQVIERVIRQLTGSQNKALNSLGTAAQLQSTIVVAHDISPADMMSVRETHIAGFVADLGGPTSHTAIVARSMDIPAVLGTGNAHALIQDQDLLVVDGDNDVVVINPSPQILRYYQERDRQSRQDKAYFYSRKDDPTITLDGQSIVVKGNIEAPEEAAEVLRFGGQGIGLFRTEFLFLGNRQKLPSEQEQYEAYAHVLKTVGQKYPVTIRTLDIGADKNLDGEPVNAVNPALGLRAIRYCLAHPEIFMTQLKALLRAAVFGNLKILVPMIAHFHEVQAVKNLLRQAAQELQEQGIEHNANVQLGAMVEIPAIAIAIDGFLQQLDFVSIGTNDLIQYTLAIDRVDNNVSHLYDPLHPAVLSLLHKVIQAGTKANKSVSICGEMAGDYMFTRLLLALGLKEFSLNASGIPEIKHIIRQTHVGVSRSKVAAVLNYGKRIELDKNGLVQNILHV